jgi:hypothetical protein
VQRGLEPDLAVRRPGRRYPEGARGDPPGTSDALRGGMSDLVYLATVLAFFVVAWVYALACDRL